MKQTHEYRHDDHRVHQILYHLIWCPSRRRPVLVGRICGRCRELIEALSRCDASSRHCSICRPCGRAYFARELWPAIEMAPACYRDGVALDHQFSGLEEQLATHRVVEKAVRF